MNFGIVVFPGSHGAADCLYVLEQILGETVTTLWHQEEDLRGVDCLIIPGGYACGHYLRPGALARFSPIIEAVLAFAKKGGLVLGLGNGFQILTEVGLLPGALLRNTSQRFQCQKVHLRVENRETPFTKLCVAKEIMQLPIAHEAGCFVASPEIIEELEKEARIILRYCTAEGEVTEAGNPDGSLNNIAGIINETGNVLGMMPRPERLAESLLGGVDGKKFFDSLVAWWQGGAQ